MDSRENKINNYQPQIKGQHWQYNKTIFGVFIHSCVLTAVQKIADEKQSTMKHNVHHDKLH